MIKLLIKWRSWYQLWQ